MRLQTNLFYLDDWSIGIYPSAWLHEHSCQPNAKLTNTSAGTLRLTAVRPISAGEAVTFCYCDLDPGRLDLLHEEVGARKVRLKRELGFDCLDVRSHLRVGAVAEGALHRPLQVELAHVIVHVVHPERATRRRRLALRPPRAGAAHARAPVVAKLLVHLRRARAPVARRLPLRTAAAPPSRRRALRRPLRSRSRLLASGASGGRRAGRSRRRMKITAWTCQTDADGRRTERSTRRTQH